MIGHPGLECEASRLIHFHMGNRGITRLDKTFGQTATTSKQVNEPYPLFITPGSSSNMRRAYDILSLATWQGVMSNIAFPPLAHPSLVCEQKGAPLCFG